jgi:hypothetical protein
MNTFKTKLHSFFFKEDTTNGSFLVFFRMGTGIFILIHLLSIILDFSKLFAKSGIIPHDIREILGSDYIVYLTEIITFFEGLGIAENITITAFLVLFIASLLALTIGFCTRFSALLALFMYKSVFSLTYAYGIDTFITTSLFYLVIFPSGYFFSVDNILFKNRSRKHLNVTLFKRLLQINVCIVYFYAGACKVVGETWWNGEAIWKSLNLWSVNNTFNLDYSWLATHSYILVILGWGVLAIETLYPIFIWSKKTRKMWLTGTLLMHVGIGLLLDLYFFAAFMMFWNIAAFYIDKPIDLKEAFTSLKFSKRKTTLPQNASVKI